MNLEQTCLRIFHARDAQVQEVKGILTVYKRRRMSRVIIFPQYFYRIRSIFERVSSI